MQNVACLRCPATSEIPLSTLATPADDEVNQVDSISSVWLLLPVFLISFLRSCLPHFKPAKDQAIFSKVKPCK